MAQHDYILENQPGAAFRGDLNAALAAIASNNSGPTEPESTYALQWWADTTAGILKQRNAGNNSWVDVLDLATGRPVGAVTQTDPSGAVLIPQGPDDDRPSVIPEDVALVRGSTQDGGDYKLEFWNRVSESWQALASRTWASAAIASAVNALNKITGTGAAPYYAARALVNFNGTGTVSIRRSENVLSVTDNGTGDYTVNFAVPMGSANYTTLVTAQRSASNNTAGNLKSGASPQTVNSVRIEVISSTTATNVDADFCNVAVFD